MHISSDTNEPWDFTFSKFDMKIFFYRIQQTVFMGTLGNFTTIHNANLSID